MKNKKIILAGGTGFMGQEMTKYFGKKKNNILTAR
jgi:NAD dependent epimerase/dehydratase family enzyme